MSTASGRVKGKPSVKALRKKAFGSFAVIVDEMRARMISGGTLMGFPAKVQLIQRKDSQQWYINFPSAVAQAREFQRGEIVEWIVEDKNRLFFFSIVARFPRRR
jgi:hypothetical protein